MKHQVWFGLIVVFGLLLAAGGGPALADSGITWPPGTPVLSRIDNPDRNGDYLVNWTPTSGATSYVLQVDDDESFPSPTVAYQGERTAFQVKGQAPGNWVYRVKALGPGGESSWSNTAFVEVLPVPPPPPTLLPIDNADGSGNYLVSWTTVVTATAYTLEMDGDSLFPAPSVAYQGDQTSLQVIGQSAGIRYYRVKASNAGGASGWSNVESATVLHFVYLPVVTRELGTAP